MAKDNEEQSSLYNKEPLESVSGMCTDTDPILQPKGTVRFALNTVNEVSDGQHNSKSNEGSNYSTGLKPAGFYPIGDEYIGDDTNAMIMTNPKTGRDIIGLMNKDGTFQTIVDTGVLGLSITNQCQVVYRVRRGREKVIYWVDGNKRIRTFNFSRPYNFYTVAYQSYIRAGNNPNSYLLERWDESSFNLQKIPDDIPSFDEVEILETGAVEPGSYNFAIQLVDEDLNPTAWLTTSNIVRIYNDSTNNAFYKIRGSKNIHTNAQDFPRASKSIKLTIGNLDTSFPYFRVGIIKAVALTGNPNKVLVSDLNSTSESNYTYSGNDGELTETELGDILIDNEVIFAPKYIEQLENRLTVYNTKGKSVNWCDYQKFASKISSDICYKDVLLNNVLSDPNIKNAKSTFLFRGYMPGEVYSMGIVYVFDDLVISPVFHIPGRGPANTASDMAIYQLNTKYLNVHNCSTNNYWGSDSDGHPLVGRDVRHHRFPFRSDVAKPLFTTTSGSTDITKYKLLVNITLNPAWIPGPISYPVDGDSNPIVIPYIFNYRITGNPTNNNFSGSITDSDMGADITIYDDTVSLDNGIIAAYGKLDTSSELFTTYNPGTGNNRFIIVFSYASYIVSSSINNDASEIFGIEFSNIERPSADVIGFYIVRNDRQDDDKLIIDNAIFGPMTSFQNYKAFGLINPKQFYHVNNCGGNPGDSGKTLAYYNKGVWFWNPEFQFSNKKTEYTSVKVQGRYSEDVVTMPTISNLANSACNGYNVNYGELNGSKGVYLEDVQAGTSYNPDINKKKNKDDDGFDLIVGYRNISFTYATENGFAIPPKSKSLYFNAASYQTEGSDILYNVSVDNKIGMHLSDVTYDTNNFSHDTTTKKNDLIYGSLVRESNTAYSNFITRTYYKEHNNPILFGDDNIIDNVQIFNGDAEISAINLVSSVFYDIVVADRPKKSSLWKIIVGAVLVVVGVVLAEVGVGIGIAAAGVALLAGAALSYGISLIVSGIKFEQFKSMVEVDYEKGLKETVIDGGVFECIRDTVSLQDDTIRWFSDRASNLYIESSIPVGLRVGLTCGVPDFLDAPAPYDEEAFRSYLIEKFTVLDRDQGSGRLYKGYATAEYYDTNPDYARFNHEKEFIHLPVEYDCCSDPNEVFPLRAWFSQQSFQEEKIDNYRAFLPNNFRDIEGVHGEITGVYRLGNSLFIMTSEGRWHLPQNTQERITNEIVSFIGTGEFFSIPPRNVIDSSIGSGGTQHNWSILKTQNGVLTIDEIEGKVHLHTDRVQDISVKGMRNFFKNNLKSNLVKQLYDLFKIKFPHDNNPANPDGVGYMSAYDSRYERMIITKRDYLILSDKVSMLSIVNTKPVTGNNFVYSLDDGKFYVGNTELSLDDSFFFENKSFTISYSFYDTKFPWTSFHSYIPNYYVYGQNGLYSFVSDNDYIWKHNSIFSFQKFYNKLFPYIIEIVKSSKDFTESTFEDFSLYTRARIWDTLSNQFSESREITFNKIIINNSYQCSGELLISVKDKSSKSWYQGSITNKPGQILASCKDNMWSMNKFRDYVIDYTKPMFTNNWSIIKDSFFIDKVPNPNVINIRKNWSEQTLFKDKFIVIRLKFDTFDNVNLVMNFTFETELRSTR